MRDAVRPLAESLGKPPFRSRGRTAGGRWKALTMSRIARGFPPTRRIACAISMGHYQRSLVLAPEGAAPCIRSRGARPRCRDRAGPVGPRPASSWGHGKSRRPRSRWSCRSEFGPRALRGGRAALRRVAAAAARAGSRKAAFPGEPVALFPAPRAARRWACASARAAGPAAAWGFGRDVPSREPSTKTTVPVVEMFSDWRLARRGVLPLRFAMAQNARSE